MLPDDELDDFVEMDAAVGAEVVKCPYCGAEVQSSLFFDEEVDCPGCGKRFKKDEGE